MISASVIRSLAVRTLMVIVFAAVANGQSRYAIRTVSGEPNYLLTATEGCADEIRLAPVENYDDHTVRWIQTFTLYDSNGGELEEGDKVFIKRCDRFLRISSEGDLKLMDNGPDAAAVFTIRKPLNDSNNANDKLVVFEVLFQGKGGYFLTKGDPRIGAGSDYLHNPRNVFKLIFNPNVKDEPSCVGEACGDVFIDGIGDVIYWTNTGDKPIYIRSTEYGVHMEVQPHKRVNATSWAWRKWNVLYNLPPEPRPVPPKAVPAPSSSDVCHGGPGIKITIEAVGNGDLWVQVTNSQTKVQSKVLVDGGAVINYLAAIKRAATSVNLVSEIIPNSHVIRVCGKDNLFTLNNARASVTPF